MDETMGTRTHKLAICDRRRGNFTGIVDVISFDISEILLETDMGMLRVKGKDLHVNRLNLEKGEVDIEGEIGSLEYSEIQGLSAKKGSLVGRLFR